MTVTATSSAADVYASLNGGTRAAATADGAGSADRFLKLLVAQMKNQDPLNPMDNAEVTTQMAQINTVEGINRLNDSVKGLNAQFTQLQAMQGAALLGHDVAIKGNRLALDGEGAGATGRGSYELAAPADLVRVEILNPAGRVVASQVLGAQTTGRHDFEWVPGAAPAERDLRFRVVATRGAGEVAVQPLTIDRVSSVSAGGDKLQLTLENSGTVDYADVVAVRSGG